MIIVLLLIFILLALYYLLFLAKIYRGMDKLFQPPLSDPGYQFVSIIIPFRNESKNIIKSMESIGQLDYPGDKYEVIYVDDDSDDNSFQLAQSVNKQANVRIIKLSVEIAGNGNKKRALQCGIDNSKGDIIITTDTDCIHNKQWLSEIVSYFDSETAFVAGPVEILTNSGLFSKIQSMEFAGLICTGAGLIGAGRPIICNGANIAYRKKVFDQVGGFRDNLHLASGDDELLMQKIAKKTNYKIKFCASREAVVLTKAHLDLQDFFNQRRRWASKSMTYKDPVLTFGLILIFLFYFGLIVQTGLMLIGYYVFAITFIISLFMKFLTEFMIIKRGEKLFLSEKKPSLFLITELFQVPYIIIASIAGLFGRFRWRGRKFSR